MSAYTASCARACRKRPAPSSATLISPQSSNSSGQAPVQRSGPRGACGAGPAGPFDDASASTESTSNSVPITAATSNTMRAASGSPATRISTASRTVAGTGKGGAGDKVIVPPSATRRPASLSASVSSSTKNGRPSVRLVMTVAKSGAGSAPSSPAIIRATAVESSATSGISSSHRRCRRAVRTGRSKCMRGSSSPRYAPITATGSSATAPTKPASNSRLASSDQCRSSRNNTAGRPAAASRMAERSAAGSGVPSQPGTADRRTPNAIGYQGPPAPRPTRGSCPVSARPASAASTSAVLPTPASPLTRATGGRNPPEPVRPTSHRRSTSNSASRPASPCPMRTACSIRTRIDSRFGSRPYAGALQARYRKTTVCVPQVAMLGAPAPARTRRQRSGGPSRLLTVRGARFRLPP